MRKLTDVLAHEDEEYFRMEKEEATRKLLGGDSFLTQGCVLIKVCAHSSNDAEEPTRKEEEGRKQEVWPQEYRKQES